MTDLLPLLERAATPTDHPTDCRICGRDTDPVIYGDDGPVCVPCAISDLTAAVVTITGPKAPADVLCIGDCIIGTVRDDGGLWVARVAGEGGALVVAADREAAVSALFDRWADR